MNLLALIGSPRKKGNTDLLIDEILKVCTAAGHDCSKIYLYDVDILLCLDCRACKKGKLECTLKDGMESIYPEMVEADLLIFGTPVYWYGPTAKMKLLVDRMRPFIASKKLRGKHAAVVSPSEEGAAASGPMLEMFKMSFTYIGVEYAGELLVNAYEKGEVKRKPEELTRARAFGKKLASLGSTRP